ncbi:MAG: hypothetical protein M0Q21_13095 [Ignavibacteriaceae bacterium]|nr:hypothetical protein [Ignavibacteriaceae bacterium]
MGRSVIIYVMGTFIILSVALLNANRNVDSAGTQSIHYMSDAKVRNICNSMTSVLLSRIADSTSLRIETPVTTTFMGGTVTYQVTSVSSIGNSSNDDHDGEHGDDDGGDDHGDDHSANFNSSTFSQNNRLYSASLLGAFTFFNSSFDSDDDHGGDDDGGEDDHEGDDDGEDDHDSDDDSDGTDTLQIVVSATLSNSTKTLTTYVAINSPASTTIPTAVQAGISTRNAVATSGNMTIDGRNHDLNGALISGSGTYGIWTTSTINQSGSSDIGGTYSGTDYAPSHPANANAKKSSGTYPSGSFPDTPDKVLGGSSAGFSEGTLKNIAISHADGSQYVTNPSSLTSPLAGVTYVELSSGGTWQSMNISGTGILIVHNTAGNAIMKNLNSGTFKGIIIADDIIHVHTSIIGAVIGLSASPSEGNSLGNGNGSIKYSKEAINQALDVVSSGSAEENYGFGKSRLSIIGWYE